MSRKAETLHHVLDSIGLAECYFLQGDITSACDQTETAIDTADTLVSARLTDQLAKLLPYTANQPRSARLHQTRSRLRTVLTARNDEAGNDEARKDQT